VSRLPQWTGAAAMLLASLSASPAAAADDESWTLRCPATGVTTIVERDGQPGQSHLREYLGVLVGSETTCVVRERGVARAMMRQVIAHNTAPAAAFSALFDGFFPAMPGESFSRVSMAQVVGQANWNTQPYSNSYTYVGRQDLRIGSRDRRVAVLRHREESRSGYLPHARFAAESTYYFDVETHELLRFEHRPISGTPRAVSNWQAKGE